MAGRIINRRELRRQADQADPAGQEQPTAPGEAAPAGKRTRSRAPAAPRKPRARKLPPRLRARWGIFDASMKQVAIFDYNQRTAADARLADLRATKKGIYFIQIVKEPMPQPAGAE
jgi:hypothetical protein